jgi:hypothetical protein
MPERFVRCGDARLQHLGTDFMNCSSILCLDFINWRLEEGGEAPFRALREDSGTMGM